MIKKEVIETVKTIEKNVRSGKGYVSLLLVILLTFVGFRQAAAGEYADRLIKAAGLKSESVAVKVIDLKTGKVLESHNSDKALTPASIMKCVSIASLSKALPMDYRYKTKVYMTGNVASGVLRGNLMIVGSGDPTLNSKSTPKSNDIIKEILTSLKKRGIERITGMIVIDQDVFKGPAQPAGWGRGDLSQSYGAGCFGLNFENNSRGEASVTDPAAVFRTRLENALRSTGIELEGQDLPDGHKKLLLNHKSAPLDEIMRSCMMRSDNLYAEAILRTFSVAEGGDGSTADGVARETSYWKHNRIPMEGVRISDGSGLSRGNKVTADFMAAVLGKMSINPVYASFFPLCGQEGTLRHMLGGTRLEAYLAMKTGSMRGIQCYAGYKLDDDYAPTHVVVVIINDMASRDRARKGVARMLLDIFPE